ncbi:fasciclin domain-containing protein [Mesohalobacter halotolerans]|uniref:Fasciclin domain-containing protein n=1 Tax=Mesohalobacter halotolerans TaxID=1883405 RepID=A0A4V6AMD0_9FLAO|nr:fasciclin domain-containing protein [Mesohalobacter halotolerans]MBS3737523.1 fasciclin domain-containing protein [Psychroflexus sp.]TKS55705.1 fasciclin domain-containing protein [Mesohalobacter halotolerans]
MDFLKSSLIGLLFFFITISCADDEAGQIIDTNLTTFDIIADSENHNTLEQLLIDTGLDQTLDNGTFTVFAPHDEAFNQIDLANFNSDELTQLLLNHVLTGNAESTDFNNSYILTNATETVSGNENTINSYVNVDGGIVVNGISNVTISDLEASNGVVHVVDAVIPIPDLTTFVSADPRFSNLQSALSRDDQPDFLNLLNDFDGQAPFTVFAPTNTAFDDLLAELELEAIDDIDTAVLTSTLNTHILDNSNLREEDMNTETLSTLGSSIDLDASTLTITDQNNRMANVIITNIQAGNGVIHAIDKVILP